MAWALEPSWSLWVAMMLEKRARSASSRSGVPSRISANERMAVILVSTAWLSSISAGSWLRRSDRAAAVSWAST